MTRGTAEIPDFVHEVVARAACAVEGLAGAIDAYARGPPPTIDAVLPVLQMAGRGTRADLLRQVHAGGAMTALNSSSQGEQQKGVSNERHNRAERPRSRHSSSPGPRGLRQFVRAPTVVKYNYFEPKGRKATHYEDMTVDVQPDPEALPAAGLDHLTFADGTPTY